MCRLNRLWIGSLAVAVGALACCPTWAQGQPAAEKGPFRHLAPGVLEDVDPAKQLEESFSRHDVVELLAFDPKFDWAKDVAFRRDIWALEFQFKPMRMIWIDIPQANGLMRRTLVWYMVYSVTNPGKVMHPVKDADNTYNVETVDKPVRFIPEFLLRSPEYKKTYPDRIIPLAVAPIRMREDRKRRFYTTVEMCREIAVGETVWGVVTWQGIDPRIDRFSIYVQGLTNAYRWRDTPGAYKKGDPIGTGRRLARKTVKLNFWRPGDEYFEHEREIRYGVPGGVDYEWVYR